LTNAITSNTDDDAIDVEMQSDMMLILSCLCDGDMHRKELFGEAGVNVCVNYLKTEPKLLNSGLGHHRLLLSAVDCVWYVNKSFILQHIHRIFALISRMSRDIRQVLYKEKSFFYDSGTTKKQTEKI